MPAIMDQIQSCVSAIRQATSFVPESAVVLGSGLGGFAEKLQVEAQVPYASLPGFPVSTVAGHAGRFLFGYVDQKPVAVMQGRVHYYEGYSMEQVVLPIRVLGALRAKELLLTNAAGGIGPELTPGCLMLLTGHIASFVPSPWVVRVISDLQHIAVIGQLLRDIPSGFTYQLRFLRFRQGNAGINNAGVQRPVDGVETPRLEQCVPLLIVGNARGLLKAVHAGHLKRVIQPYRVEIGINPFP